MLACICRGLRCPEGEVGRGLPLASEARSRHTASGGKAQLLVAGSGCAEAAAASEALGLADGVAIHRLRVASARGILDELLHMGALDDPDGRAAAVALPRPNDLRQRVAVDEAGRIFGPWSDANGSPLNDNRVALLRLQHDIGLEPHIALGMLNIFRGLHDLLMILDALVLLARSRRLNRCASREDHTDGLLATVLLSGAHLQATNLVDAEPHTVFCALVKHGSGRL
mmetsp:Transcript_107453/g.269529  ORF Transcript_107453/g.269529 Transcript_107453/m.269529 type:complete len:227 (-) Transcript_107453:2194-2874(-)